MGQEYLTNNHGRICLEIETCGRLGPGASAGAAIYGSTGGSFCEGNNVSGGAFFEGGAGFFEGAEATSGTDGSSASASFKAGAGGGGSAGVQTCLKRTFCFP